MRLRGQKLAIDGLDILATRSWEQRIPPLVTSRQLRTALVQRHKRRRNPFRRLASALRALFSLSGSKEKVEEGSLPNAAQVLAMVLDSLSESRHLVFMSTDQQILLHQDIPKTTHTSCLLQKDIGNPSTSRGAASSSPTDHCSQHTRTTSSPTTRNPARKPRNSAFPCEMQQSSSYDN